MRILLFVILIAVTTGLKAQSVFTANGSKCLNSQLYDGFLKSFNKTAPALPQIMAIQKLSHHRWQNFRCQKRFLNKS